MIDAASELKEKCVFFLRAWTRSFAERIEYSLSGYNYKIVREGLPEYKQVVRGGASEKYYKMITGELIADRYQSYFQLMLDKKMGDCAEQSIFLAAMLKNFPLIDKNYVIFSTNTERCPVKHTFLTLIPRGSTFFENNKEFTGMTTEKKGRMFTDNKDDIIVVDPWRNMVFVQNVDASNHPLNFSDGVSFENTDFCFQNFDHVYKKLQSEFVDFYKPYIIAELKKLSEKSPEKLKQALKEGRYNSALRLASADPAYIKIVRVLLESHELLGMDIHEKGMAGNALDVAVLKKNALAVALLESHYRLNSQPKSTVSQGKSRDILLPAPVAEVTDPLSKIVTVVCEGATYSPTQNPPDVNAHRVTK